MDFSLNETQQQIETLAARLFSDYCSQEQLRRIDSESDRFDRDLWQAFVAAGLPGLAIDERQGGMGLDLETLLLVLVQAGRHVAPLPLLATLPGGALVLQAVPGGAARDALLGAIVEGHATIAPALPSGFQRNGEPGRNAVRVTGSGSDCFLSGGPRTVSATPCITHLWTIADHDGEAAICLLPAAASGVDRRLSITTSGNAVATLTFDRTPCEILATGATALAILQRAEWLLLLGSNALAIGVCEQMLQLAITHTSERVQFGKAIATFQAVAHKLADCHIDLECLRATQEQAVCHFMSSAAETATVEQAVLSARINAVDALHRISHATQQVHGGTGVDRDYPLFRYCLLARELELEQLHGAEALERLGRSLGTAA
jgi:alkylation response protein AidB-like acyl-CoA dehydrogenase